MQKMSTYQQAIDYLYSQLPQYSRIGNAAFKGDLTNIRALCKLLNYPEQKFQSIHVGGTNGKGSVSHMLAAIFQQAGYKTGLYTSPHLKDFRERIRINGKMISEAAVVEFMNRFLPDAGALEPSFFELTVAMAFDHFAREEVDIAIIEVGMGGRLDSTNVIMPELAVITNISYDHQQMLGTTLPAIANEKAGIIKENIPVVIGESHPETTPVFEQKAREKNAPIYFADKEWNIKSDKLREDELDITISGTGKETLQEETFNLDITGQYQVHNLCTVLTAWHILRTQGWDVQLTALKAALRHVKSTTGIRGRWEVLERHPLIVAEVAHNEGGIRAAMAQLALHSYDRLHIVCGFVKDKEVEKVLTVFPASAHYYFCNADVPRALDAISLQSLAAKQGLSGQSYTSVKAAFTAARDDAGKDDLILVCGSFFVVSEILN